MPAIDRPAQTIEEKFLAHRRQMMETPKGRGIFNLKGWPGGQLWYLVTQLGATPREAMRIAALPIGGGTVPLGGAADLEEIVLERAEMGNPFTNDQIEAVETAQTSGQGPLALAYAESQPEPIPGATDGQAEGTGAPIVHFCSICDLNFNNAHNLSEHLGSKNHASRLQAPRPTTGMPVEEDPVVAGEAAVAAGSMGVDEALTQEE